MVWSIPCLLFAIAVLLLAVAVYQDHLLYFPQRATLAEVVAPGLAPWPSAGDFRGLIAEPAEAPRATAIVFHGNAGHAGHREYYARTLAALGVRVILAEYPGYGPRDGKLGEESLVSDAAETIDLVSRTFWQPILVVGESLGAGVAAYHYPWLPVGLLLRNHYDSVAHLAAFQRPIFVVLAERDRTVPARFGQALYDALPSRKRLVVVPGVDHTEWPALADEAWWREAVQYLLN
jgi:pimeloyl-ACP methyl ester carboxylesterase